MENVSHNTSYSESSPNVNNENEEFVDESAEESNAQEDEGERYLVGKDSAIADLSLRIVQLQTIFKSVDLITYYRFRK